MQKISIRLIWNRPYNMFCSKVDKRKYPNVKQKYRFELVKGKEGKEKCLM